MEMSLVSVHRSIRSGHEDANGASDVASTVGTARHSSRTVSADHQMVAGDEHDLHLVLHAHRARPPLRWSLPASTAAASLRRLSAQRRLPIQRSPRPHVRPHGPVVHEGYRSQGGAAPSVRWTEDGHWRRRQHPLPCHVLAPLILDGTDPRSHLLIVRYSHHVRLLTPVSVLRSQGEAVGGICFRCCSTVDRDSEVRLLVAGWTPLFCRRRCSSVRRVADANALPLNLHDCLLTGGPKDEAEVSERSPAESAAAVVSKVFACRSRR